MPARQAGINTWMRVDEVFSQMPAFVAAVRVVAAGLSLTARTAITAETAHQARAMLTRIYGSGNVLWIQRAHDQLVQETDQPSSPGDQQIRATQQRAKQVSQQARQLSAQRSLQRAQQKLARAQRSVAAGGTHQG